MNPKELTIETAQVEIKVVRVGGHKMTLAVFNQIEKVSLATLLSEKNRLYWTNAFDSLKKKPDFQLLGYVKLKDKTYLLYVYVGKLRKSLIWAEDWSYQSSLDENFVVYIKAKVPQLFIAT